ncbi:hypothetical protein TNCV_4060741 [Trichonephila clavipes]|nr:hypothetical protein TNCV_4060741 [Trichonephila clavipes]
MMGRQLHLLGNVVDLARQLEQIWQEVQQETIEVLYHSMPRRVAVCIQSRGKKLGVKITCCGWYPPIGCRTKKRHQLPGKSAMEKLQTAAH